MEARELEREEQRVLQAIKAKQEGKTGDDSDAQPMLTDGNVEAEATDASSTARKRKKRWDVSSAPAEDDTAEAGEAAKPKRSRWDQAPAPGAEVSKKRSRWDQAPSATPIGNTGLATPAHPSSAPTLPTTFGTRKSSGSGFILIVMVLARPPRSPWAVEPFNACLSAGLSCLFIRMIIPA